MQKRERFLPRQITRFNYWKFEISSPKPAHLLQPFMQHLGEFPETKWKDRPGRGGVQRHIQQEFQVQLNGTSDILPFNTLKFYVECEKEWRSNKTAQKVLKELSARQRIAIDRIDKEAWPQRSKRPARLIRTWTTLFNEIAQDVDLFERFIDCPPAADEMSGTPKRIYLCYRKEAIKLLGGGTYIHPTRRNQYKMPDLFDDSVNPPLKSLLTPSGWLPSKSKFKINWLDLSAKDRRPALKLTIHWFHHALRNLREYRNRRPEIPWTDDCEITCRDIQKKLLTAKT